LVWTAYANGGTTPEIEYCFWLYDFARAEWRMLRDYAVDPVLRFAPDAPGTYTIEVWARGVGSAAAYEAVRTGPPFVVVR
jgi:hypothetical protein